MRFSLLFQPESQAQSSNGQIAGNVVDPTGAAVPNAVVTVTNKDTGGKNVTKSGSAGSYRFPSLPIGSYTVTATAPGFATATNTGVVVTVNSTTALNISLTARRGDRDRHRRCQRLAPGDRVFRHRRHGFQQAD